MSARSGGTAPFLVHFIQVISCISWMQVLYMFFRAVIEGDAPWSIKQKLNTLPLAQQNPLIFLLELSVLAGKS